MQRFDQVMTIESNWSDRADDAIIDESNRRYSALAMLLRSRYLVDIDCWSERARPAHQARQRAAASSWTQLQHETEPQ